MNYSENNGKVIDEVVIPFDEIILNVPLWEAATSSAMAIPIPVWDGLVL